MDPELSNVKDNTSPVELDHVCTVPTSFLDKSPMTVKWTQKLRERSATYYQVVATNTSRDNTKLYLLISESYLDNFRKLDSAGGKDGKITFKVYREFQYGQRDKNGRNRFLVFHEGDRFIYQTRFVQVAFQTYGNMLGGFVDRKEGQDISTASLNTLTRLVGEPLKSF